MSIYDHYDAALTKLEMGLYFDLLGDQVLLINKPSNYGMFSAWMGRCFE
jgi:hypothetical protein